MGKKEQALETLEQKITYDSIEFYKNTEYLLTGDFEEYINTDLQTFVNYIHQDSNYIWLRDASRDSVLLEIMSVADNSVRFWVNNGRMQYHRFWASNKICDTIGTWIQVMPQGNRLKIYVDEDVYQSPAIEKNMLKPMKPAFPIASTMNISSSIRCWSGNYIGDTGPIIPKSSWP